MQTIIALDGVLRGETTVSAVAAEWEATAVPRAVLNAGELSKLTVRSRPR